MQIRYHKYACAIKVQKENGCAGYEAIHVIMTNNSYVIVLLTADNTTKCMIYGLGIVSSTNITHLFLPCFYKLYKQCLCHITDNKAPVDHFTK